ncbi:MAG: hypothetical protein QOF55_1052 [Thermoleophilaceae bacterium]|jgi:hypothetical protein|nr:hypothetical protein [Thermoleophilaceae bacterium]MEA2458384.1 hypothetical protein [Thermoleophilaceae bacterium]
MRPSLTNISKRARAAAEGSSVPAGQEQLPPAAATSPRASERGSMRRRARRLARTREVLLRELGALVVEARRLGRENPDLIARKATEIAAIDEELSGLRAGLEQGQRVEQIVAAGVSGSCARCATLLGSDDRFCPHCGLPQEAAPAAESSPAGEARPVTADGRPVAAAPPPPPPPPPPAPPAPEPSAAAPPQS